MEPDGFPSSTRRPGQRAARAATPSIAPTSSGPVHPSRHPRSPSCSRACSAPPHPGLRLSPAPRPGAQRACDGRAQAIELRRGRRPWDRRRLLAHFAGPRARPARPARGGWSNPTARHPRLPLLGHRRVREVGRGRGIARRRARGPCPGLRSRPPHHHYSRYRQSWIWTLAGRVESEQAFSGLLADVERTIGPDSRDALCAAAASPGCCASAGGSRRRRRCAVIGLRIVGLELLFTALHMERASGLAAERDHELRNGLAGLAGIHFVTNLLDNCTRHTPGAACDADRLPARGQRRRRGVRRGTGAVVGDRARGAGRGRRGSGLGLHISRGPGGAGGRLAAVRNVDDPTGCLAVQTQLPGTAPRRASNSAQEPAARSFGLIAVTGSGHSMARSGSSKRTDRSSPGACSRSIR